VQLNVFLQYPISGFVFGEFYQTDMVAICGWDTVADWLEQVGLGSWLARASGS